jgi:hypothetical protein
MSAFSPSDAAFEGFRLTREKPLAVLTWAAIFATTIVVSAVLIVSGFAPRLAGAASNLNSTDPQTMIAVFAKLAPVLLALLAVWVGLSGVIGAAIYRRVLTPADSRGAYLRFGKDELRQVGALFICLFAEMVFSLALEMLFILPMRLGEATAGARLTEFVAQIAAIALNVWFGLRLALLPAMTFAVKRIDVLGAWRLTRGQFWRMLGMLALALTLALMVYLLLTVVSTALAVLIAGGDMGVLKQLQAPEVGLSPQLTIAAIVYALIGLLTPVVLMVIVQAPTAYAYRALAEGEPAGAADI